MAIVYSDLQKNEQAKSFLEKVLQLDIEEYGQDSANVGEDYL
jgi:hypothetical protein